MAKDIQSILQATIEEGRIEEFKRSVEEITRAVEINESGIIGNPTIGVIGQGSNK